MKLADLKFSSRLREIERGLREILNHFLMKDRAAIAAAKTFISEYYKVWEPHGAISAVTYEAVLHRIEVLRICHSTMDVNNELYHDALGTLSQLDKICADITAAEVAQHQ